MEHFLEAYTEEVLAIASELPKELQYFSTYMTQGGKMNRPRLYLDVCNSKNTSPNLEVAIALELLHMSFLIHDDIMDNDDMRRDHMTLHKAFEAFHSSDGAKSLAMLVGNMVLNRAMEFFSTNLPEHAMSVVFDVIHRTEKGQLDEFIRTQMPSMEETLQFYKGKTSYYSIYLPLYLGYYEDTSKDTLQYLWNISEDLGILLQLWDDALELLGQKGRSGGIHDKSDLINVKPTPPLLHVLPHLPEPLREEIYAHMQTHRSIEQSFTYVMPLRERIGQAILDRQLSKVPLFVTMAKQYISVPE